MKIQKIVMKFLLALCVLGSATSWAAAETGTLAQVKGVFISTGDNHWLGQSLAVDTPASIADAFDMFKNVWGIQRVYWRGMQEAAWAETFTVREDSFRCAAFDKWFGHLIKQQRLEKVAADIAHARKMELWGVSTLGDWGASADTPSFYDFPFHAECKLRLEHPEWVPVDKYGYRRQGGTIELAYPEARRALVDLHVRLALEAGYDGVLFLSYVENFSLRFQDEFGFSEPIVAEFKRRYGIDIRYEPFNRHASRDDWYRLRGEYLTAYLRELKAALKPHNIKLGMFIDPRTPRFPLLWATLPHTYCTLGHIYFDLESWVREGIVDELSVYGNAARTAQEKTIDDCLWLTRGTTTEVTFMTSSPLHASWQPVYRKGPTAIITLGDDEHFLLRSSLESQSVAVLESGSLWQKMRFLSQVASGETTVPTAAILPFVKHANVLMRRLALTALGKLGDPVAVPFLEAALMDPEIGVRCRAMQALGENHRPESTGKILAALAKFDMHPMHEAARTFLPQIKPFPRAELVRAARSNASAVVRTAAIRSIERAGVLQEDIAWLREALNDPDGYTAFSAATALSAARDNPEAVKILIWATGVPRVAVANRAATSLAKIVQRDEPGVRLLRSEILSALERLFREMGDSCKRSDREWGYRPVGEALLACGAEGELLLNKLMAQTQDRRLSELAWRVLYIREKAGENNFNIITEKEDEAAFRARPDWMKTNLVARLQQNFEHAGLFKTNSAGAVGATSTIMGRWGPFGEGGPSVTKMRMRAGRQAVQLTRGGDGLVGWTDAGIAAELDCELQVWVYREQGGALTIGARDSNAREVLSAFINAEGVVCLREGTKWTPTTLKLPAEVWTKVALRSMRTQNAFTVALTSIEGVEAKAGIQVALSSAGAITQVAFTPQGVKGSICYLDEVALMEVR